MLDFEEETLRREIEKNPGNPKLFAALGDLYYSRNDFQNTIDAYERALSITFDFPHVLNNLAWLYATCDDIRYRRPDRALILARNAAELNPSPETLDTLGESYYINGEYEKAIEAGKKSLDLSVKNRGYYEGQLEKFLSAKNL
jgi:tetratricopeptide (TPR) repeat protein